MLPDVLARDVASLSVEAPRPAMVLAADIAADGHWSAPAVQFGWVRLAAAPAYDQLDALLAGKPLPRPLRQPVGSDVVQLLWQFAQLREQRRVHNGGYLLYKPDVDVRAPRGGGVQLVDSSQISPARRIVTEAMVIACAAAAQLAVHAGVPLLFRSQPPLREPPLPPGLYTQPSQVLPLFRCLAATATAPTPAPHAVIGEPAYVQVTSPLRRYGDLLAQQQLLALWRGEPPPWSAADVMARHQLAEQGQQARRGAQRKADRYFKLVWLAGQRPGRSWPAQVVRPAGHGEVVVTLPELAMDAVVLAREARVGDQLSVVVRAVDPAADRLELNAV
jgi:exoribonuclease-2